MEKYRVFISFKNTDNGVETKDAVMATELYNVLTENNIPTFFSKVSVLESGEGDYRNLIDAALDECSILIAVGTKKQYLASRWVKYEYASFHEDILSGNKDSNKCTVCSYIADIPQRELPRPLRNLQAFEDIDDLLNFVRNHIRKIDEIEQNQIEELSELPVDSTEEKSDVLESVPVQEVVPEEEFVEEASSAESAEDEIVEEIPVVAESSEDVVTDNNSITEEESHKVDLSSEKPVSVKKVSKKAKIGILSAVAAVAVIIIISVIINLIKNVNIPVIVDGEPVNLEFRVDDFYVNIKSAELNEESVTALTKISDMENIILTDCTFTDESYRLLENIPSLKSLTFENVQGVSDFSFLKNFRLTEIKLINCGLTDENHSFGEGADDICVTMDLSANPEFSDLSFVQSFTALQNLKFDSTNVKNLQPLKNHPALKVLSFKNCGIYYIDALAGIDLNEVYGDNNLIFDISSLAGLTNLECISFENNGITKVTEDFKSLRLKHINLNNNHISSLIGFKNLTVLEKLYFGKSEPTGELNIFQTEETGFDVLIARNAKTLKELDVSNTSVTCENLAVLTNADKLQMIDISGIATTDLSFLANCSALMRIYAENCGLNNIDALAATSSLVEICLAGNSIKDLSNLKVDSSVFVFLDLSDNGINQENLNFLYSDNKLKFAELLLYGNKITDLAFLENTSVSVLGITYDESIDPSMINCTVYIENIPDYKIVAYEDSVGSGINFGRYFRAESEEND